MLFLYQSDKGTFIDFKIFFLPVCFDGFFKTCLWRFIFWEYDFAS